jgi:hypothetical protein
MAQPPTDSWACARGPRIQRIHIIGYEVWWPQGAVCIAESCQVAPQWLPDGRDSPKESLTSSKQLVKLLSRLLKQHEQMLLFKGLVFAVVLKCFVGLAHLCKAIGGRGRGFHGGLRGQILEKRFNKLVAPCSCQGSPLQGLGLGSLSHVKHRDPLKTQELGPMKIHCFIHTLLSGW